MWEKGRARRKDEKSPDVGPRAQVRAQATVVTSETSSAAGLGSCLVAPALQAQPGARPQQTSSLLARLAAAAPEQGPLGFHLTLSASHYADSSPFPGMKVK